MNPAHTHPAPSRPSRLFWAIGITASILVLEAVGGVVSGSLALLSDAGHMLTDLAALLISVTAMILAARPVSATHTFGYARLEVLAALGNAFTFLLMTLGVAWESYQRFEHPSLPEWKTMGSIALAGLLANALSLWFLRGAREEDLNSHSAFLHVLGDLASSVGVLAGAAAISATGWTWIDPALSLAIALLVALGALRLMRKAFHILLESAPRGLTQEKVGSVLTGAIPAIREVHHVHLWEVGSGAVHLTAHLVIADQKLSEAQGILQEASDLLKKKLDIRHATFQLESPSPVRLKGPEN